ncbi:MAG: tRNA lysidine(34) synthetase TilS [Treponema sp.]|jgi:tRNA(Ile)-lysidine synthase|nr:tRNA lysidine(34) synthetase TilS [Treponema sp.]
MDNFEAAVLKGLGPLPPGTILLAAVSGGADSTAMLVALSRLRATEGFTLRVAHVDHGIRPAEESRGDAAAVESLCVGLGLPCRVLRIAPGRVAKYGRGMGIEAAARHFRYRLLRQEALRCGAASLVVAHTRDDALELGLMRVLRGAGPAGLARMPSSRNISGLPILRPLLNLSRGDVEDYLTRQNIPWRSDATNKDEHYLRNHVRATLVPLLEAQFPGWKQGLEALGDTQSLTAAFIAEEARRRVVWEDHGALLRTGAENFFAQPLIIREEALFQALNTRHWGASAPRRNLRHFAAGDLGDVDLGFSRITRTWKGEGAYVTVSPRKEAVEAGFSLLIKEPGLYKLESGVGEIVAIRVIRSGFAPLEGGEGPGFYATLPLLLRFAQADDVIALRGGRRKAGALFGNGDDVVVYAAQDMTGLAAFVGVRSGGAVILRQRERGEAAPNGEWFFCNIGGIDAQ